MKNFMYFLIIAMLTIMVSCSKNPTEPKVDDPIVNIVGELRLVPLSADGLAKVATDANGQMWLPASEISNSLMKTSVAAIDFGQINSTTGLMFVIMNTGNRDVFDVQFEATDLDIVPGNIGLISISTEGVELTALPIITITKEHVLPKSGVGSLLPMTVGSFIDNLKITYHYITGGDTVEVVDDYDVDGTKMGIIIDVIASGQPILNHPSYLKLYGQTLLDLEYHNGEKTIIVFFDTDLAASIVDTTLVINSGNVNARIRVSSRYDYITVLDTILQVNDTLNVSNYFSSTNDAYYGLNNQGSIIKVGVTEYIMKLAGIVNLTGLAGLSVRE